VIEADIPDMSAFGPCLKIGAFLLRSGGMAIGMAESLEMQCRRTSPVLMHAGYSQAEVVRLPAKSLRTFGSEMPRQSHRTCPVHRGRFLFG
jgi:hypothetical protein